MKKKLWLVVCMPLLIIINSYGQKYVEPKDYDSLDAKGNVVALTGASLCSSAGAWPLACA